MIKTNKRRFLKLINRNQKQDFWRNKYKNTGKYYHTHKKEKHIRNPNCQSYQVKLKHCKRIHNFRP